eukprot:gene9909-10922_t
MKTLIVLFFALGCVRAATGEAETQEEAAEDFDEPIQEDEDEDGGLDDIPDDKQNFNEDEELDSEIAEFENNPRRGRSRRRRSSRRRRLSGPVRPNGRRRWSWG